MRRPDCPFCQVVADPRLAITVGAWPDNLAILPRHPVVDGHTLVLPRRHVTDACEDPVVTARTMAAAAQFARGLQPANLITSIGEEATQTVFHLHIHIVPRRADDGLHLPWTPSQSASHTGHTIRERR